MDFNKYHKECGHHIEFQYGQMTGYCPVCNKEVERKDTIAGYTRDSRINQLKAMHALMLEANDERIYMSWIYTMPDCPSEDDFPVWDPDVHKDTSRQNTPGHVNLWENEPEPNLRSRLYQLDAVHQSNT